VEVALGRWTTVGFGVSVGVLVGVGVTVGVLVDVGVQVGTAVFVGLGVDVGVCVLVKVGSGVRVGGTCAMTRASREGGAEAVRVSTSQARLVIATTLVTISKLMASFQSLTDTSWSWAFRRFSILSRLS
jgi:hypothetical protein